MPSSKADGPDVVWQDREIKFDSPASTLALRDGEFVIDVVTKVEDTKGNNGDAGNLTITNLRVIWRSARSKRANLSIGYASITSMSVKQAASRLKGVTNALFVMTKFNGSRFEFIFTNLDRSVSGEARARTTGEGTPAFLTLQAVHKAYDKTKLYRDLKLRGAVIANDELKLLPNEEVYNKIGGVMNLSNSRGNDGVFHLTNVRLVWHAENSENFNVSIPYLQMRSVAVRDSKFGRALVVTTTQRSGGYVLGFRVESSEKLEAVHREVEALHRVFTKNPIFGVAFDKKEGLGKDGPLDGSLADGRTPRLEDDVEIVDGGESGADLVARYYADGASGNDGTDRASLEPVFDETLGLAIEPLPPGATAATLWNVA